MISAHEVEHAGFGRAKPGESGYEEGSVDEFLDRVVATLRAIENHEPRPNDAVTSQDIVHAVFGEKDGTVDGGYDLDDVDDLLDQVAQRLFEEEKSEQAPGAGDRPAAADSTSSAQREREYAAADAPADGTSSAQGEYAVMDTPADGASSAQRGGEYAAAGATAFAAYENSQRHDHDDATPRQPAKIDEDPAARPSSVQSETDHAAGHQSGDDHAAKLRDTDGQGAPAVSGSGPDERTNIVTPVPVAEVRTAPVAATPRRDEQVIPAAVQDEQPMPVRDEDAAPAPVRDEQAAPVLVRDEQVTPVGGEDAAPVRDEQAAASSYAGTTTTSSSLPAELAGINPVGGDALSEQAGYADADSSGSHFGETAIGIVGGTLTAGAAAAEMGTTQERSARTDADRDNTTPVQRPAAPRAVGAGTPVAASQNDTAARSEVIPGRESADAGEVPATSATADDTQAVSSAKSEQTLPEQGAVAPTRLRRVGEAPAESRAVREEDTFADAPVRAVGSNDDAATSLDAPAATEHAADFGSSEPVVAEPRTEPRPAEQPVLAEPRTESRTTGQPVIAESPTVDSTTATERDSDRVRRDDTERADAPAAPAATPDAQRESTPQPGRLGATWSANVPAHQSDEARERRNDTSSGSPAPVTGQDQLASTPGPAAPAAGTVEAIEQYPATDLRVPLPRPDVNTGLSAADLAAQTNHHPEYSEYRPAGAPESPQATADAGDTAPVATPVARPESIARPEPIDRPSTLPARDDNSRKGLLKRIFKG